MSRSGGMSQLFKGIIIGVVLIMAIIGTMSLLEKDKPLSSFKNSNKTQQTTTESSQDISAPSITLNPNDKQISPTAKNTNIGDLNAEIPDQTNKPALENNSDQVNDKIANEKPIEANTVKPVLEDERTTEEAETINYGVMEINAINSNNNQKIKANYVVFNQKNVKVAENNDSSNVSYRLPVGQYKVETTLTQIDQATNKVIPVLSKSRYVIVRKNTTAKQTFELEPPATTGVLQVTAKMNNNVVRANFVIQKANGEVIASRNNVTNSLFKLDSGTYKVSVSSGGNKDYKSVEIKAGESTQTEFTLKQAAELGKLLVRVFEMRSSTPVRADITISSKNGSIIQDIKEATQTELSLAPGDYKIRVIGPNGTSNKNIKMRAGLALNEVFRFDAPTTEVPNQDRTQPNGTQITENVTIKAVEPQPVNSAETENTVETNINDKKVTLSVFAQDEKSKKPMKSNIYIQTTAGKHLDKRTYVDSANFSLSPGVYKVTVRAKNRNNMVKTLRITKDQNLRETFLLVNPNEQVNNQNSNQAVNTNTQAVQPKNSTNAIETGFLNVSMRAPRNQRINKNQLKTHFIVAKASGEKIVELTSVNNANFKLDVGAYVVTAINNNKRKTQRINIAPNQNTRLNFNISNFIPSQAASNGGAKGSLRSRIVDDLGRPLKGNLVVTNTAGQVVARANGGSTATFDLLPARYTISLNYQGLSGSEVVNISPNKTTIQTFTIAPNNQQQNNSQNRSRNSSRDIKDLLKEKLKEEIRKQF